MPLLEGDVRRHSSRIRPSLTEDNKAERVKFSMEHVCLEGNGYKFDDMYNVVHVDEIWFNEDTDRKTYYLLKDESDPIRTRKSKRFIGKTMFIAAVARPRFVKMNYFEI